MDLNDLIEQNYKVVTDRNRVTESTSDIQFVHKIREEVDEVHNSFFKDSMYTEIADVILVCLNFARHKNIDIEKLLIDKINYNKIRDDWK